VDEDAAIQLSLSIEQAAAPVHECVATPVQETDGRWAVRLFWTQGPYEYATLIREDDYADDGPPPIDSLALQIAMDLIEEPQGPTSAVCRTPDGRRWLP
jgi:hypothetical protein